MDEQARAEWDRWLEDGLHEQWKKEHDDDKVVYGKIEAPSWFDSAETLVKNSSEEIEEWTLDDTRKTLDDIRNQAELEEDEKYYADIDRFWRILEENLDKYILSQSKDCISADPLLKHLTPAAQATRTLGGIIHGVANILGEKDKPWESLNSMSDTESEIFS